MIKDEALKLALEALETYYGYMEPLLTVFGGPRVPAEQSTTWKVEQAITSIKEALAQPEQDIVQRLSALVRAQQITIDKLEAQLEHEPVAWYIREKDVATTDGEWAEKNLDMCEPLYTSPPQRTWVGLTDEEIQTEWVLTPQNDKAEGIWFGRRIEAKVKKKNT